MLRVSILAVGSEILDGRVPDTNSSFIASRLADLGVKPGQFLVCDDIIPEIVEALRYLQKYSDFIIVTGGLGPTTDDVTREALASFGAGKLCFREEEYESLRRFFERRNRPLNESHRCQAMVPDGAELITNPVGTASGFFMNLEGLTLVALPGVPAELMPMYTASVEPVIKEKLGCASLNTHLFRVTGLAESEVGDRVERLGLSGDIFVSYRAAFPEIQVKLKTSSDRNCLNEAVSRVREAIGARHIFSEERDRGLEDVICELFTGAGKTLAAAESCTGGMLGKMLTSVSGSSAYFAGGVVTYSNEAKVNLLGVDSSAIEACGAVSDEVARRMAKGASERLGTDYGVSITGVAGPAGGTEAKPVGTFFVGLSTPAEIFAQKFFFPSDRERIRRYACFMTMNMLRKSLLQP